MISNVEVIDIDLSDEEGARPINKSNQIGNVPNNLTQHESINQTIKIEPFDPSTWKNSITKTEKNKSHNNDLDGCISDRKPQINVTPVSPQKNYEKRKKKIDDLLDLLDACRNRLNSCQHLMNEEQKTRWNAHQPSIILNIPQQPPFNTFNPQQSASNYRKSTQSPSLLEEERDDFFGLPKYDYVRPSKTYSSTRTKTRRTYRRRKTKTKKSPKKTKTSTTTKSRATSSKSTSTTKPKATTSRVKNESKSSFTTKGFKLKSEY